MPFTLAHPVAVLPLARCAYLHFPALVLGSLSPDFVYFLGGKAAFNIGHTWLGCLLVNLPLCFVFYAIYVWIWRDAFKHYLPNIINTTPHQRIFRQPSHFVLLFATSAIIGMMTHIILDNFTHETGYFVQKIPFLRAEVGIFPLFKWLQYTGGVLGLLACVGFLYLNAQKYPQKSPFSAPQKMAFWAMCAMSSLILLLIWQAIAPISWRNLATWTIRIVDCAAIAFTLLALKMRFQAA